MELDMNTNFDDGNSKRFIYRTEEVVLRRRVVKGPISPDAWCVLRAKKD